MARLIGIDYGKKRTGLAWSDPLQIIATGIGSFDSEKIEEKIRELCSRESVEAFVLGYPTRMDGSDSHVTQDVKEFAKWLQRTFPDIQVHLQDERFTSKEAKEALILGGASRKKRRDKHLVNQISATLILQEFMNQCI
ncbi:MAG: Holliday junction resolvase RuvX [Bacteroidota bacterium]